MPDERGDPIPLGAIHAASETHRWQLLTHAVKNGSFMATETASILGLPGTSGNARRTYAEGLREDGLLQRTSSGAVSYRPTALGRQTHSALARIIAGGQTGSGDGVLHSGGYVEIVADLHQAAGRAVVLRISDMT